VLSAVVLASLPIVGGGVCLSGVSAAMQAMPFCLFVDAYRFGFGPHVIVKFYGTTTFTYN